MTNKISVLLFLVLVGLFSCEQDIQKKDEKLFKSLDSDFSGINFSNNIIENDTLNYFTFPYLYMGGGVAIGDINNDGLSDIYFTGNMTENKLYLNKGNMTFEDITLSSGTAGDERWYTGVTMADVNNDGWLDIYTSVSGIFEKTQNQLFINNKDNTFTEQAAAFGLDDASSSIQATFFDYNGDDYIDVFIANYPIVPVSMGNLYYHGKMQENNFDDSGHLFKNNGDNTFTNVTAEAGVQNFGMTLGVVASDYNNDGFQDLYLSNDFNVPDYFYLNNGDGTFKEVLKEATSHTAMFGMGIDVADFNNDQLLDFIQLDMTPEDYKRSKTNMASMSPETFYEAINLGLHYQYMQNVVQINNGVNGHGVPVYSDVSRLTGLATTDWSWGALFADFDNDGLKDIVVTNGMKRDVNNNDVNERTKVKNFSDLNKEIDYKQYPSTPIDNYVFQNKGNYRFSKANDSWGFKFKGFSNGVSYGDLDNDGDLDLVINNLGDPVSVFENRNNSNNFLKISFQGSKNNKLGLGTKVTIFTKSGKQYQEHTLTRGFQSSVEPKLHFGLGDESAIDSIKVVWPNDKIQVLAGVDVNSELTLKFEDANDVEEARSVENQMFENVTDTYCIMYKHTEDEYDDYALEPLLPHKNSQMGPALAVGDINRDGLDDFFIGNAAGSKSTMFVQNTTGTFDVFEGPWQEDFENEDTGALLFDADGDEDLDLYVVSGGNNPEMTDDFYQDRLYINTSTGFVKSTRALPKVISSGQRVSAEDFDKDGDLDLFVGGRIIPGKYPFPAKSYLLENKGGQDEKLVFEDVTRTMIPELDEAGLVTSNLWDDFNGDGKIDLVIAGEWMPIRFFENTGEKFIEVTSELGFANKVGWWYGLQKVDLDNDGDIDYLAGNLGLNYKYKAKKDSPFEVYANDFDENGKMDIVLSYKKKGIQLPLRGRECSSQQVPAIKRRFQTFELFADASLADIYGQSMLDNSLHYKATIFANSWIENKGQGTFIMHELPNELQFSSFNDFEVFKYGNENVSKIIAAGNLYQAEVETPRNDAGIGSVFYLKPAKGEIEVNPNTKTGLFLNGEIKNIEPIYLGKNKDLGFLLARNNDSLQLIRLNNKK